MSYLKYIIFGALFGFVLTKAEVISWFRIQEMFRFQDFHMYGVIGSAIVVGLISVQIIKRYNVKDIHGQDINIAPKDSTTMYRYAIGGTIFGLGWALTGACPGPLFALVGSGLGIIIIPVAAALLGTWVYGITKDKLPH